MVSVSDVQPTRPKRADARRNYDKLLCSASQAFAEQGAEASLDDIARAAGVGSGTLYRHFPSRETLIAAVLLESFERLEATGDALRDADDPFAAVDAWLHSLLAHTGTFRGLAATLCAADEGSPLGRSCSVISATTAALVDRAITAGAVRPDVDAMDLNRMVHGIALAAEGTPDWRATAERMLALTVAGLRP